MDFCHCEKPATVSNDSSTADSYGLTENDGHENDGPKTTAGREITGFVPVVIYLTLRLDFLCVLKPAN